MKRPFAIIGITYLITLVAASLIDVNMLLAALIFFVILFALSLFSKGALGNRVYSLTFFTIFAALVSFLLMTNFLYEPVAALDGYTASITGRVIEEKVTANNRNYYIVETSRVGIKNAPQKFKLRLSAKPQVEIEPFEEITADVMFYTPPDEYGLDSKQIYKSKGIYLFAYPTGEVSVSGRAAGNPYAYAIKIRRYSRELFLNHLKKDQAALVTGIAIGDDSFFSDELYNAFKNSGILHIIAVSGLHISIIMTALLYLFSKLKLGRKLSSLITIFLIMGFILICGLPPSAVRSGIMCMIFLAGRAFFKKSDPLNSLGLSVLIMTVINPFSARNISLLYSFASTLGIIVLSKRIYDKIYFEKRACKIIQSIYKDICLVFSQSIAAIMFTLPISILVFGAIPLMSPLTNILTVTVSSVLLVISCIAMIISAAGLSFLAGPLIFICGQIAGYINSVAIFIGSFKYSTVYLKDKNIVLWFGFALILTGFTLVFKQREKLLKFTAALSVFLLVLTSFTAHLFNSNVISVAVLDVGNGFSAVLSRNGKTAVIGCGGDNLTQISAFKYLSKFNSDHLEFFLLPRLDDIYANRALDLTSLDPNILLIPGFGKYYDEFHHLDIENAADTSTTVHFWGNCSMRVYETANSSAVLLDLNSTLVLITTPQANILDLPPQFQKADVLICTSAEPENAGQLKAKIAVVSGESRNAFMTMSRLGTKGIKAVSTGGQGNIIIKTRGNGEILTARENY